MKLPEDKPLQETLRRWKVSTPLPPRFQENVWRRIEQAEARPTWTFGDWWQAWLTRAFASRALALSYVTALLMVGLAVGYWQGRAQEQRLDNQLAAKYVQSVSPSQTVQ